MSYDDPRTRNVAPPETRPSSAPSGPGRGEADLLPTPRAHARSSGSNLVPVLLALLVGLALGIGATLLLADDASDPGNTLAGQIDRSSYQAVILANDRVYFGQIRNVNADFYRLQNAYFLRESTGTEADAQPVRALLPVNREIHGPENSMLLRKDEVVLIEDLASDSPILREIKRQRDGSGSTTTTAP